MTESGGPRPTALPLLVLTACIVIVCSGCRGTTGAQSMVVSGGQGLYDIEGIWEDYGQPGGAGSTSLPVSVEPTAAAYEIHTLVQKDPQFILDYTDGRRFSLIGAEARSVAASVGLEVAAVAPFYRPTWPAAGGHGTLVPTGEYGSSWKVRPWLRRS